MSFMPVLTSVRLSQVNSLYAVAQSPNITKFFFFHHPEKMQWLLPVARWISQFVCRKAEDRKLFSMFYALQYCLSPFAFTLDKILAFNIAVFSSHLRLQTSTWQSLSWQTTFSQRGPLNIKMVACDVARQQADLVLSCSMPYVSYLLTI